MFNPSREQARRFFFDAWRKYRDGEPLSGLEKVAVEVIVEHPEYHALLDEPERSVDRDFTPTGGAMNPFLHLSLHLAVREQLAVDQPRGLRAEHGRLAFEFGSAHAASHAVLECLGETLWQAQRLGTAPDEALYLDCLRASGRRVNGEDGKAD
jgi:hypothetical protein